MKKLYEQSPEMHLSGKRHLRHVKCTHHKGYLMEDLSMIKSGFYEISFCKSGDFLFRIGQKRHFITNGDILVTTLPPVILLQTIMILSLYGWKNHIFPI